MKQKSGFFFPTQSNRFEIWFNKMHSEKETCGGSLTNTYI